MGPSLGASGGARRNSVGGGNGAVFPGAPSRPDVPIRSCDELDEHGGRRVHIISGKRQICIVISKGEVPATGSSLYAFRAQVHRAVRHSLG